MHDLADELEDYAEQAEAAARNITSGNSNTGASSFAEKRDLVKLF